MSTDNLFEQATKDPRRLKMYIYGEAGTGKTVTSLSFPNPAVIDTERGTVHYGKFYDFNVKYTSKYSEISTVVDSLIEDPRNYKSLIIDPFSNVYDSMQEDLERYLRKKKGDVNYQLSGLDYRPIKKQIKSLIKKLNSLDMNIVLTARSKTVYSSDSGEFMKQIGTAPEGPAYLAHMFDVAMEITMKEDSEIRTAHVKKDRTNSLPKTFDFTYEKLVEYFGIEDLEREPVKFDKKLQNLSGRNLTITHKNKEIQTAGITSIQLKEIETLSTKIDQEILIQTLQSDFGIASFLDLREDEAALFIADLKPKK